MAKQLVICLDGCGPEYLKNAPTPVLDQLARGGVYRELQAIVPTVTNVNNVSIVTNAYPNRHGITSNYFRDPETGQDYYMEAASYILCDTIFDRAWAQGRQSALLTVKHKLRTLLNTGATIAISAESLSEWLIRRLGEPPSVYSLEVNHWLIAALRELMRQEDAPDLVYVSTTDYPMHMHGPTDEASAWHLSQLDALLGEVLESISGDVDLAITADHGMRAKTRALDLTRVLGATGIQAETIPIIKDRYVLHHHNLGGAAYVYLADRQALPDAIALLRGQVGVEDVLTGREAAIRYHLHPRRIGDLLVLGTAKAVFGNLDEPFAEVEIRSHGSLYERTVPAILYGKRATGMSMAENKDVTAWIGWD